MQVVRILVAALAGYRFVAAAQRWQATLRVLGLRSTVDGIALMSRIRTRRLFNLGGANQISVWLIHPNVPLLFELQAVAFALLLVLTSFGWHALVALLRDPVMVLAAIWGFARASESILPPCLLYLGVSEPGQFENIRYFASSRTWLVVSAIEQENPSVNLGESAAGPIGSFASLASDILRRIPVLSLLVILPIQRRRLESIRTSDDLWEASVRSLIEFVPMIIADLRSPSMIVCNELVWVLEARALGRLVVVTRPDGTTSLTRLLDRLGIDPSSMARLATNEQLNAAVAEILDRRAGDRLPSRGLAQTVPEYVDRLGAAIRDESVKGRKLLLALTDSTGTSRALDDSIHLWAEGSPPTRPAPAYTASLSTAVALLRRRLDKCSYSLHIGADGTAWVDLAVQSIAESFRVSISFMQKPLDSLEKALIMALLNAELGKAWARVRNRSPFHPVLWSEDFGAGRACKMLVQSFPFLQDALTQDGWHDPVGQQTLAGFFGIPPETLLRSDEHTMTDELQRVIEAVQGKGRYVPRGGPYSLGIDVTIEGQGRAEVARKESNRWLIARSAARGARVWVRPGVALMIAALKAEHGAFDVTRRP
jgi:hypothetical protein